MKRTSKRERTNGRDVSTLLPVRRRAFLATALAVTVGVFIGAASGCHTLFPRGYEDGRYLNGVDATSDWERARMESADDGDKTARNRRVGSTTARGAEPYEVSANGSNISDNASWTERIFHWPPFTTKNKRELELERELELTEETRRQGQKKNPLINSRPSIEEEEPITRNAVPVSRNNEEATSGRFNDETASNASSEQKKESNGFWSRLFPSRKTSDSDEDSELVAVQRRNVNPAKKSVDVERPVKEKVGAADAALTRRQSSRSKPWNRRGAVVEQYQQTRFLPPMGTITRYYSSESVQTDKRLHARSESLAYGNTTSRRDSMTNPRAVEKTASLPASSYRSNSYAPRQVEDVSKSASDSLPESPRANRGYLGGRGAASLSPIAPSDHKSNGITQMSGSTRANGLGKTRPIASAVPRSQRTSVATTSFTERRPAFTHSEGVAVSPESLFGWSAETAPVLESFEVGYSNDPNTLAPITAAGKRDVDESFRNSLGSQTSYDWFETVRSSESIGIPRAQPGRFPEGSGMLVDGFADALAEQSVTPSSNVESSTFDEMDSDGLSELNVDPRMAVSNGDRSWIENESVESLSAEEFSGNESQEYAYDEEIDGELDLDSIVDDVIARGGFSAPESESAHDVFAKSTVSGGSIASDLADAIMESVDADDSLDSKSVSLGAKASVLSETAPETLNSRKTDQGASPLTQEEIAWIGQVKNAIRSLLVEREEHKRRGDDVRICDARLRLLYLVIGEYERSIQEIQDESDPLRNFWEKECRGLETLLQNQLEEIDPTFVAERLRSGLDTLSGLCKMRIRKLLLVESPACYGLFEERVDPYECGEALYAYSELDYVTSRETDEGFSIDVECRWRLLTSDGTPLTSFETQRCANLSETKLRDVVLNVSVPLPEGLEPGVCLLELEVRDLNAAKPETCVERLTVRVVDGALATGYVAPSTAL